MTKEELERLQTCAANHEVPPGRMCTCNQCAAYRHILRLQNALERMDRLYGLMMAQCNLGASALSGECIREMNEAPIQASLALKGQDPPKSIVHDG